MHINFLTQTFHQNLNKNAIIWNEQVFSFQWLLNQIKFWENSIEDLDLHPGSVIGLEADFSPNSIALFLALTTKSCIIVPLHKLTPKKGMFLEIAMVEFMFRINETDEVSTEKISEDAYHEHYQLLKRRHHPGLVLFSSGTSGEPKGAVHDFINLLSKFKKKRSPLKILNFLLFDHWGGLNTMLHTLSNSGTVLTINDRSPNGICKLIEQHQVEILPTSPTFLNILLLSGAYKQYDLSSLKVISYGTEPMTESTLKKMYFVFPNVTLQQTYGLIEVGVLRSKSRSSNSLWVKVGGEGFETRVVDGLLEIKAASTMLGYLNASNPFTEDGWFMTGDSVEVDGEYLRILGRQSELINVGGEKVYPSEVESVIQKMDNVAEVTVFREKNLITGNIVCAKISLVEEEDHKKFIQRLKKYCRQQLSSYKVPIKVKVTNESQHSVRYKKIRFTNLQTS